MDPTFAVLTAEAARADIQWAWMLMNGNFESSMNAYANRGIKEVQSGPSEIEATRSSEVIKAQ